MAKITFPKELFVKMEYSQVNIGEIILIASSTFEELAETEEEIKVGLYRQVAIKTLVNKTELVD